MELLKVNMRNITYVFYVHYIIFTSSLLYSLEFSRTNISRKLFTFVMVFETFRLWHQVYIHITAEHELFLIKYLRLIIEALYKTPIVQKIKN